MQIHQKSAVQLSDMHPNVAGLDIDAHELGVCVPANRDIEAVRAYGTFTPTCTAR